MKPFFVILVCVFCLTPSTQADAVEYVLTTDGDEYRGDVVTETDNFIRIQYFNGAKSKKKKIPLEKIKERVKIKDKDTEEVASKYFEPIGISMKRVKVHVTEHYKIFSDTGVSGFDRGLEDIFEFVCKEYQIEDDLKAPRMPVVLYASKSTFKKYLTDIMKVNKEVAKNIGGYSVGEYFFCPRSSPKARIVVHEATHQVINYRTGVGGKIGTWFTEGLAQYIEFAFTGADMRGKVKQAIRNKIYTGMEDFFGEGSFIRDNKAHSASTDLKNANRRYMIAAGIIDFLVNDKKFTEKFPDFLSNAKALNSGAAASATLVQKTYGLDVRGFEDAYFKYFGIKTKKRK